MVYSLEVPVQYATGEFYDKGGPSFYLSKPKVESDYSAVRYKRELQLFRRFCKGGDVLDVGCSTGGFLFNLKRTFCGEYTVLGTDVVSAALTYAEGHGVRVVRGEFLNHDFGDARFDAVTLWAVLEHLVDPAKTLLKVNSILKPGGLCFILVPNLGSIAVRMLGARYRYFLQEHLNYFDSNTLRQIACKYFECLHLGTTHFNPIVIFQDLLNRSLVSKEGRAQLLERTTGYKQSRALFPLRGIYWLCERVLQMFCLSDNLVFVGRSFQQSPPPPRFNSRHP